MTLLQTGVNTEIFNYERYKSAHQPQKEKLDLIWLGDIWGDAVLEDMKGLIASLANFPKSYRNQIRLNLYCYGKFKPKLVALLDRIPKQRNHL